MPDALLRSFETRRPRRDQRDLQPTHGASAENVEPKPEPRKLRTGEVAPVVVENQAPADGIVTVLAKRGRKALPDIIQIANEADLDILSVEVREPDLEAVFLHLTGRALRD